MPFPIKTAFVTATDGPELLALLESDASSGGGQVLADSPPHRWALRLQEEGALDRAETVGLAAALIQRGTAAAACVGARLAAELSEPELGRLLLQALGGLDVGLLLTIDPLDNSRSTEDSLLFCAQSTVDTTDTEQRHLLLAHLRRAGLADTEFRILADHGSPAEIRLWLPAILEEIESLSQLDYLQKILERGPQEANAMARAIRQLPEAIQNRCREHVNIPEIDAIEDEP